MKITKEYYANAHKSLNLIEAALTALAPLTLDVLGSDAELRQELDTFCAALEGARLDHQVVIEAGETAKNSVDPVLINRCLERIGKLQGQIKWKNGELQRMNKAYENRLKDALTARVPVEKFRPLDVAPTPEDESRIARERALMELEIDRIHAFLGTIPFCDFSLLMGTQLEQFIPGEAA
jgi:hypothetical protein